MFCRILCCFIAKFLFYAIYAVLSRNLFCRNLRALAWRKIGPTILSVEKKGQISGMDWFHLIQSFSTTNKHFQRHNTTDPGIESLMWCQLLRIWSQSGRTYIQNWPSGGDSCRYYKFSHLLVSFAFSHCLGLPCWHYQLVE